VAIFLEACEAGDPMSPFPCTGGANVKNLNTGSKRGPRGILEAKSHWNSWSGVLAPLIAAAPQ
jgi:hypothetical protein